MIEHPLRHAYLIPGNPQSCVRTLKKQLEDLYADRSEKLRLDPAVMDTMLIDDAHELSRRGRQQSSGEVWCLLRGFSRTNREAQNAVLKVLEEPAEGTHFFFVTPAPNQLLETVRSRMTKKNLCISSQTGSLAESFLQADDLPTRLSVIEEVIAENSLRQFFTDVKTKISSRNNNNTRLQRALVKAASWLNDVGRSDQQIAEFLAISAEMDDKRVE